MNNDMIDHGLWNAVQGLLRALRDAYRGSAGSSGRIEEATVPVLLDTLRGANERERAATAWILWSARQLLLAAGDASAVPDLTQALRNEDDGIRRAAARALGWIGDERAVPELLEILGDEDDSVRRDVAGALGKIGDVQAVPALLDTLRDESEVVRYAAAWALGQTGSKDAVPDLVKTLRDENRDVRRTAARALGWIGDEGAVPDLIEALGDESSGVRRDVAGALGKIGDARATPGLLKALDDEREAVRYAAAWALGEIGNADAVSDLVEMLHDENHDVRRAVAEALGKIGDARAVPALLESLRGAHRIGDAADTYAFGVTLYEMLTASLPAEAREFGVATSRIIDPVTEVSVPAHELAGESELQRAEEQVASADEIVRRVEELVGDEQRSDAPAVLPSAALTQLRTSTDPKHPKADFVLVIPSGQSIPLTLPKMIIGRSNPRDSVFPDIDLRTLEVDEARTVSRSHCQIFREGDDYFVEDLESRNGTRVNDKLLEPGHPQRIQDGDTISAGRVKLTFQRAGKI